MRVTLKLVGSLLLLLILIRSVEGFWTVSRESARLEEDIQRDSQQMQVVLDELTREVWSSLGEEELIDRVDRLNTPGHPVRISWERREGSGGLTEQLDEQQLESLSTGQVIERRLSEPNGALTRHMYMPVKGAEQSGAIRLVERLAERSRYRNHAVLREVVAGSVVILLGGSVIVLLGVIVVGRPLDQLRSRIDRIGEGDLESRVVLGSWDELSHLAEGLNQMCSKLSASQQAEREATQLQLTALEQMRHADRLTTIGRLASGVAHELGTPLNVVIGRAEMIERDPAVPEKPRGYAGLIKSQGERMSGIIQRLLNFARHHPQQRVLTDLGQAVDQARALIANLGYKGKVRVNKIHSPATLNAHVDPGQVQQVLLNLIENALQAMPQGGEVVVEAESLQAQPPAGFEATPGRYVRLTVSDQGEGIDPDHLREVFDPFFTTKDVGEGSGLGLSIAYGIARDHGGWIDVKSTPGKGSWFAVYLPQGDPS